MSGYDSLSPSRPIAAGVAYPAERPFLLSSPCFLQAAALSPGHLLIGKRSAILQTLFILKKRAEQKGFLACC